jgi:hypothetical protein
MPETSMRMRKMTNWTLWRGRPSSETEEEPTTNVSIREAGNVGTPATWDNFAPPFEKKTTLDDSENLD